MLYYNYCNMIYVYTKIKNICLCNTHTILGFSVSSRPPLLLLLLHISLLASFSISFFILLHLSTLTLCWAALGWGMVPREEGETGDGRGSVSELTPDFLNNQMKEIYINIHISHCKKCAQLKYLDDCHRVPKILLELFPNLHYRFLPVHRLRLKL